MPSKLFAAFLALALPATAAPGEPESLTSFDAPFAFAYGSWLNRAKAANGTATIAGDGLTNAGGAGLFYEADLLPFIAYSPAIKARVLEGNKAAAIRVLLMDAQQRTATWTFPLDGLQPGGDFALLTPKDGAALASPHDFKDGEMPDLSAIKQLQIQGDWSGNKPMAVEVDEVLLVPENPDLRAARDARARQIAEEREAARKAKEAARAKIRHTPDSPAILHVGAVAPDILGITIQSGSVKKFDLVPYEPQPDDTIQEGDHKVPVIENGTITVGPTEMVLVRKIEGRERKLGYLVGGAAGKRFLSPAEQLVGTPLEILTVDDPSSYAIRSDDPALPGNITPTKVSRKSFVTDRTQFPDDQPNEGRAVRHIVYLHLSEPLKHGTRYTISFPGVNTREPEIAYTHDSRANRSEAVHASQIGYRPGDPFKRGFVSIWLGSGGAYQHASLDRFELIAGDGKTVFEGKPQLVLPADGTEKMRVEKNYSGTAVWALDFSAFSTSGTYRLHLPGIGTSYPIAIAEDAWAKAFATSMHGFLSQRASIALGPPFTTYRKPLNFHPDVGTRVFQSAITLKEAEQNEGDWFGPLTKARTDAEIEGAWGGYMDAGDYDRIYNHMLASYLHMELVELFPAHFENTKLALPPAEANNRIPDVLDEALWNLGLYRRLQRKDGAVSGGVESSSHPRFGEPSWLDSLVTMAYEPDPLATFTYAAVGAKMARLLAKYDKPTADAYAAGARKAWLWAEEEKTPFAQKFGKNVANDLAHLRALAAVELLWLTGDPVFDAAFKESSILNGFQEGGTTDQASALFTYARLPENFGDPEWKAKAKARILADADVAVAFGAGNAFGITTSIPSLPEIGWVGYFTTPEMIAPLLPRAHFLTGDPKYLAAAVRATNFTAGANPQNMTFTTGLGHVSPQNPLQIDHRHSNQPPPAGITLYGATDPARDEGFCNWAYIWVLGKWQNPSAFAWPATEAFCDVYMWPAMTEYTVRQTMGPASYYWGYLSAR